MTCRPVALNGHCLFTEVLPRLIQKNVFSVICVFQTSVCENLAAYTQHEDLTVTHLVSGNCVKQTLWLFILKCGCPCSPWKSRHSVREARRWSKCENILSEERLLCISVAVWLWTNDLTLVSHHLLSCHMEWIPWRDYVQNKWDHM